MSMQEVQTKRKKRLVLASASPRRLEICQALGLSPQVLPGQGEEILFGPPAEIVCRNAENKVRSVQKEAGAGALILGADTIVVNDGAILGKPQNSEEARQMLEQLSGGWHRVYTGMALAEGADAPISAYRFTEVHFAPLSREEIEWYLQTGEPFDKAGAYGIQGKAGLFIREIRGDYGTVVGLCPRLLLELMAELNHRIQDFIQG